MPSLYVGTSGWTYSNWKGVFYPRGVRQSDWLSHYAQQFDSVELNATFYRPPQESLLAGWNAKTPADFTFAVKAWRMLTHQKKLRDCHDRLVDFLDRLAPLGRKAGPLLCQLPPSFPAEAARLDDFLSAVPAGWRVTVEPRDASWHEEAIAQVLARHNAAFCCFELADQRSPAWATADFVYVRLHGREDAYRGFYSDAELAPWADWLAGHLAAGRDAYCYFDNTDHADDAPRNAARLRELVLERRGIA